MCVLPKIELNISQALMQQRLRYKYDTKKACCYYELTSGTRMTRGARATQANDPIMSAGNRYPCTIHSRNPCYMLLIIQSSEYPRIMANFTCKRVSQKVAGTGNTGSASVMYRKDSWILNSSRSFYTNCSCVSLSNTIYMITIVDCVDL